MLTVSIKRLLLLLLAVPGVSGDLSEVLGYTFAPTSAPTETLSANPTGSPTIAPSGAPSERVTDAPTGAPTESPAPSPSPSAVPTSSPTQPIPPTLSPSAFPTESPQPSPSPSAAPTNMPSLSPSSSPSAHPTVSAMPSSSPSTSPSDSPSVSPSLSPSSSPSLSTMPSSMPSWAPSGRPSESPSHVPSVSPTVSVQPSTSPSKAPSDQPSEVPSASPSATPTYAPSSTPSQEPSETPSSPPSVSAAPTTSAPSSSPSISPTEASFRTKTGVTNVLLVDIEEEMTDEALRKFEIVTETFIRDTQPTTSGYLIEIVAVTVLSQTVIYPPSNETDDGSRRLESLGGLQVAFRTVGIVAEGNAPRDLDFTTITDDGFQHHFNEYLYQLSISNDFFAPLTEHVTIPDGISPPKSSNDKGTKGQFAAAIVFSTLAFVIALSASYYAIRKHIRKQNRTTIPAKSSYPDLDRPTQSSSLANDFDEEQQSGRNTKQLSLEIGDDRSEMEEIGLTPPNMTSPFTGYNSSTPKSPATLAKRGSRGSFGRTTQSIKKWLTPRRQVFHTIDLSDPPESEVGVNSPETEPRQGRLSVEPDALKASTASAAGTRVQEYSEIDNSEERDEKPEKETINMKKGNTPLGIPVGFFGRSGENKSDATSGNLGSLAGSTASSFFSKMGKAVFTGEKKATRSTAGASQASENVHQYKFGSTPRKAPEARESPSENSQNMELNAVNLTKLQSTPSQNIEASLVGSSYEQARSKFERLSSGSSDASSSVRRTSYEKGSAVRSKVEVEEAQEEQSVDTGSVYSEQSEFDLNDMGVEMTLGALPPKYASSQPGEDRDSFVGHQYDIRPDPLQAPSAVGGARSQVTLNESSLNVGSATGQYTLGARAMAEQEEKRRASLSAAIKEGDTYDVFAPAGPIGIVVDTSGIGPAVHSLKPTSPMLGLINPGDLIIALDDEDTRNMTASSLTRLMAKKSRQKERKITLLAPEGF